MSGRPRRFAVGMAAGSGLLVAVATLGVLVGTTGIDLMTIARVLGSEMLPNGMVDTTGIDPVERAIVWSLRVPRVLLAGMVGSALALAGVQMQGLFRNALASPAVIGTSAGASLGAVIVLAVGWSLRSMYIVPLFAVAGAFLSLMLVTGIAVRVRDNTVATLLLAGIAVTAFIGAINSYIIARSWEQWEVARRIAFWLMGGVMDRDFTHVWLLLPGLVIGTVVAIIYAPDLDLMLEGDETATSLGVDVERTGRIILLNTALLTGSAVAVSGVIGFVGLVVPHFARLLVGPGHRRLVILSSLIGAVFLIAADIVARTAARPQEVHLGVVTAFVGAPFFLFLLMRGGGTKE